MQSKGEGASSSSAGALDEDFDVSAATSIQDLSAKLKLLYQQKNAANARVTTLEADVAALAGVLARLEVRVPR
jgi:hypothetical protein